MLNPILPDNGCLLMTRRTYDALRAILTAPENNVQIREGAEGRISVDTSTMPETAILSLALEPESEFIPEFDLLGWPIDDAVDPPVIIYPPPPGGGGGGGGGFPPWPDPDPPDPFGGECWSASDCATGLSFALIRDKSGYSPGDVVFSRGECWTLEQLVPCPGGGGSGSTKVTACDESPCAQCFKLVSCQNGEIVYTNSGLQSIVDGTGVGLWDGDCWTVTGPLDCTGETQVEVSGMTEQDDCDDEDCPVPCDDCVDAVVSQDNCDLSLSGVDPSEQGGSCDADCDAGDYAQGEITYSGSAAGEGSVFSGTGVDCYWVWTETQGLWGDVEVHLGYDSDADQWWGYVSACCTESEGCCWVSDAMEISGVKCNNDTGKLDGTFTVTGSTALSYSGSAMVTL